MLQRSIRVVVALRVFNAFIRRPVDASGDDRAICLKRSVMREMMLVWRTPCSGVKEAVGNR
jgi:hypothetical protein